MCVALAVAYYVEGRSREQCARRWEQLHPKSFKKGKWTIEEDKVSSGSDHLLVLSMIWMLLGLVYECICVLLSVILFRLTIVRVKTVFCQILVA